MKINHLDLFSGIGGFSLGLEMAGIETSYLGFSDIDPHANKLFKRRFPHGKELGSVTTIQPGDLPRIDLVTFGFPCQDLSIAGKRGGLQANRSGLFFKAIEIIGATKPKYIIFENVKGLFSSNGGKDFDIVLRTIADLGYDGQWQLLNTRWFLPQNRERIYFIGYLRGESPPKVFPIGEDYKDAERKRGKFRDGLWVQAIDSNYYKGADGKRTMIQDERDKVQVADYRNDEGFRVRKDGVSPCLATRKHSETDISTMPPLVKSVAYRTRSYAGKEGSIEERNDHVSNALNSQPKDYMIKSVAIKDKNRAKHQIKNEEYGEYEKEYQLEQRKDNISYCVKESTREYMVMNGKNADGIRRLTPIECERLQGFPDNWTDGQSDTQRYKQLGNAVSVPVVKAIMERLYKKEN